MFSEPAKIVITTGDPLGIGPEVTVRALKHYQDERVFAPLVIGRPALLRETARDLGLDLALEPVSSIERWVQQPSPPSLAAVYDPQPSLALPEGPPQPCAKAGVWSAAALEFAARLAARGDADALVTGPISKAALALAGIRYPGHTEMLASITRSRCVAMMFLCGNLRVSLATTHCPLRKVPLLLTTERIVQVIELTADFLRRKLAEPRLAVCGLNPHAGEEGLLGSEDERIVAPAVETAVSNGLDCLGPLPADSLFIKALRGEYDAVLALYHDQGQIPAKLHGGDSAVQTTLGLPFPRVSVAHGTAFDLAGKAKANPESMITALSIAAELARA